jgi:hypothetical protein
MSEMLWYKRFHGTAYDPKFTVAGEESGSTHCNALAIWDALLETTSENEDDRGSLAKLDFRVVAAGLHLAVDEVRRIWDAFVSLGMIAGERVAKWAKRQGAVVAKVVKPVSDGAKRQRAYRRRKKEDARQGQFEFAQTPLSTAAESVTPSVTQPVTSATEEEGRAKSLPPSIYESLEAAKAGFVEKNEARFCGRDAPLSPPPASDKVVKLADSPALKAKKKEMRRQKVLRFLLAHYSGDALRERMNGMMGLDRVRDEQWWFDRCDAEMKLAHWNDVKPSTWQQIA